MENLVFLLSKQKITKSYMGFLRKIWAIYAVSLFIVMMIASVPVLLLRMAIYSSEDSLKKNLFFLYHRFTPLFLALIGVRLNIHGREKLDPNQAYVIVANHRSALDFIINAHAMYPYIFRYLAKSELLSIPVFGYVVKKMTLTVDRTSRMSRARSVIDLRQHIKEGWSVFLYPEGGRNRTEDTFAPFYDGAFSLAIAAGVPIAVQTVPNVSNVTESTTSIDLRPGVIDIYFDAPVWPDADKPKDLEAYKEKVREVMRQYL